MKKTWFLIFLAVMLAFTFVACTELPNLGDPSDSNEQQSDETGSDSTESGSGTSDESSSESSSESADAGSADESSSETETETETERYVKGEDSDDRFGDLTPMEPVA